VIVKIDLFSDFNKFRQSSCGIQFFCSEYTLSFRTIKHKSEYIRLIRVTDNDTDLKQNCYKFF